MVFDELKKEKVEKLLKKVEIVEEKNQVAVEEKIVRSVSQPLTKPKIQVRQPLSEIKENIPPSEEKISSPKPDLKSDKITIRSKTNPKKAPKTIKEPVKFCSKISDYQFLDTNLGEGAYATVRSALHTPSSKKVAVKTYSPEQLDERDKVLTIYREIDIIK